MNENADFFRIHGNLLALQMKTICALDNGLCNSNIWSCLFIIMQPRDKDRAFCGKLYVSLGYDSRPPLTLNDNDCPCL